MRSIYYHYLNHPDRVTLLLAEQRIFELCKSKSYWIGYRNVHGRLRNTGLVNICVNKIRRIMKKYGWLYRTKPKKVHRMENPY